MAAKKKAQAKITPDRAERMTKGPKIAGRAKGNLAERRAQNAGVKDGTIRIGKSGKSYNVYDAATGTWRRGVVSAQPKPTAKPSTPKPTRDEHAGRAKGVLGPKKTAQSGMPSGAGLPPGTTRVINGKRYQWRGTGGGGWKLMSPSTWPKK